LLKINILTAKTIKLKKSKPLANELENDNFLKDTKIISLNSKLSRKLLEKTILASIIIKKTKLKIDFGLKRLSFKI
jgi:hypothetical protein